jgi:site-specific recombinase XerD
VISYVQKKTKKQEYLPVSKEALKYLPARTGAEYPDLVFKFPSGGYVNQQLKQWVFTAGINKKITFHVARHTNATLLLSLEVPIETVSKILGHSDIKTTQIYAKVIDRSKREAVNKLDGLTG